MFDYDGDDASTINPSDIVYAVFGEDEDDHDGSCKCPRCIALESDY